MFVLNRRWDAARELNRVRDEIDHLFSGVSGRVHEYPPVNVWANEKGGVLTAELPGMSAEDVEISVLGDTVTLKGSRPELKLNEGEALHRNERGTGAFARTLKLPYRVDSEHVEASFQRGVLTVQLPRASSDLPRKISIKAE